MCRCQQVSKNVMVMSHAECVWLECMTSMWHARTALSLSQYSNYAFPCFVSTRSGSARKIGWQLYGLFNPLIVIEISPCAYLSLFVYIPVEVLVYVYVYVYVFRHPVFIYLYVRAFISIDHTILPVYAFISSTHARLCALAVPSSAK